jgi:hypothetical protein
MPDVAFAPGPKVAGKRIPVPTVRNERVPASAAKAARKTAAHTAAGAPVLAASASRAASTAARSARTGAKSAARSAKTGAETGAAAVRFAQNVIPRQRDTSSRAVHRAPAVSAAIAAGVGLEYLLDPADGRRRRRAMRDKTLAATRRFARRGAQSARYATDKAQGVVHTATSSAPPPAVHTPDMPAPTGGTA